MKCYVISDTHFGHENMLLYEPQRVIQMQIAGYDSFDWFLVERWNEEVGKEDRVLHLGDVAFKDGYRYVKHLNGKVTLIKGNHDKLSHLNYYKSIGWDVVEGVRIELKDGKKILHKLNQLFKKESKQNLLSAIVKRVGDEVVMFSHFPVFDDNPYDEKFKAVKEMLEFIYIESGCDRNIHGHIHSKKAKEPFCINVSVEHTDFRPKLLSSLTQK